MDSRPSSSTNIKIPSKYVKLQSNKSILKCCRLHSLKNDSHGQYSQILHGLEKLVLSQGPFYVVFQSYEGMQWDDQKHHQLKTTWLHYTTILSRSIKNMELVSSLHNRGKNELNCISGLNWLSAVFLLVRKPFSGISVMMHVKSS